MTSLKLFDIDAELRHETELAFLIFDGEREFWLPKSKVENNGDGSFTMPEWMAIEKGLV